MIKNSSMNLIAKNYFNIFLVRHAETEENKSGIIQGQKNTKLSQVGIEQAKRLGHKLSDIKFTYVYSSDLDRAKQTAAEVLSLNNYTSADIIDDKLLRERKFGVAEGTYRKDLVELAAQHGLTTTEFTPKGAETTFEVHYRAVEFFENLCKEMNKNIIDNAKLNSCEYNSTKPIFTLSFKSDLNLTQLTNEKINDTTHFIHRHSMPKSLQNLDEVNLIENNIRPSQSFENSINTNDDDSICSSRNTENSLSSSYNSLDECSVCKNVNTKANGAPSECTCSKQQLNKINEPIDTQNRSDTPSSDYFSENLEISSDESINVLVFSHGALIREMIKYFALELRCTVPVDHSVLKVVPPNTSVSKFTVTLGNELPKLSCHMFHDKEHLTNTNLDVKTLCNM